MDDELLDIQDVFISDEYFDEDLKEVLRGEFFEYLQGDFTYWDKPVDVFGYKIGAWFLEVVRNDFPHLFVD